MYIVEGYWFKVLNDVIAYFKLFALQTKSSFLLKKMIIVHKLALINCIWLKKDVIRSKNSKKQINLNNSMTNKTGKALRWRYSPILVERRIRDSASDINILLTVCWGGAGMWPLLPHPYP